MIEMEGVIVMFDPFLQQLNPLVRCRVTACFRWCTDFAFACDGLHIEAGDVVSPVSQQTRRNRSPPGR